MQARIERWHHQLAEQPARIRSKPGAEQRARPLETEEDHRRRKATSNRALSILKAALNRAYDRGHVHSPDAWHRAKPFRGVEEAKVRYLDHTEVARLLNILDSDFKALVQAALYTGARYGELASLRVEDYRPEAQAVEFPTTKAGKKRSAFITDEATGFFDAVTAGRKGRERMFLRADGSPWGRSHQHRRMREACAAASVDPPAGFHILRHTYASLYLMSGGDLVALSRQLGHADTRMTERHYGHLADAWRREQARKHAPSLGSAPGRVHRLRRQP